MTEQIAIVQRSLHCLGKILQKNKYKNILLVTGKKSFRSSGAEKELKKYLKKYNVSRFYDFDVNPCLEDVVKGVSVFSQEAPDVIIAIGGGSVIDMAKLINSLAIYEKSNYEKIIKNNYPLLKNLPLIAIPTTAGSGSEATHFAVIYIDKVKYSLAHKSLLANYVIINPMLTDSLPSYLAASSAIDALSHAVESYWSCGSNSQSKYYASKAIKMILPIIKDAVFTNNLRAKNTMALASYYAGKAINITKTTASHAISYPLTTYFNVPHGHAVGLTLGKFFVVNSDSESFGIGEKRRIQLNSTMTELFYMFGCDNGHQCCVKWNTLLADIGLEVDLRKLGIRTENDIQLIINNINVERLENNPVQLTKDKIHKLLTQ